MVDAFGPGTILQLNPRGVRTFIINVLVFFWATFLFVFIRQRSAASLVWISWRPSSRGWPSWCILPHRWVHLHSICLSCVECVRNILLCILPRRWVHLPVCVFIRGSWAGGPRPRHLLAPSHQSPSSNHHHHNCLDLLTFFLKFITFNVLSVIIINR